MTTLSLGALPKDFVKMARAARRAGFTVELQGNGHIRWTAPDGRWEVTASSFTDTRGSAPRIYRAKLRKIGVPGA